MTDPVIGPDGHTYERKAIESWLLKSNTSPVTRKEMESKNLIPNIALKSTIEQMLPEYVKKGAALKKVKEAAKVAELVDVLQLEADTTLFNDELLVKVTVVPPADQVVAKRKRAAIICVLDVSGSMQCDASVTDKKDEQHGFTRLDLVKHSVNTTIHSLEDGDLLGLVTFSDKAKVVLPLTNMSVNGQEKAEKTLMALNPDGSTNIWDGLRVGLDLTKDQKCSDKNVFLVLLTDGEPNVNPPQGIVPTLKKYIDMENLVSNIHVFGYGYQLDTVLLTDIAKVGLGTYGYIPDCSMVGTIFVNFISNALSTVTNLAQITLRPEENTQFLGVYGNDKKKYVYQLGGVQYGQTRDILFRFTPPKNQDNFLEITLNYGFGLRKQAVLQVKQNEPKSHNTILSQLNRAMHINGLSRAMAQAREGKLAAAEAIVQELLKKLVSSPVAATDELTKLIVRDIQSANVNEGQVAKAFEKAEWYNKWGLHYIPALILGHKVQVCTNFKDPGLQSYGGNLFKALQNEIDTIFIKLPPPEPSIKSPEVQAPANMASYYNYYGGCIAGHCSVLLADGSLKMVRNIRKGDVVKTSQSQSKVACVLKTCINSKIEMVQFSNGLQITSYHPVKVGGQWKFPIDIAQKVSTFVPEYFNFVLESGHNMIVNGVECITLGHGLTESEVVKHDYLGTDLVVKDLQKAEGWTEGLVQVGQFERDPLTQRITKMLVEQY